MPDTFRRPNLDAKRGGVGCEPYVSARKDGASLGLSQAAQRRLDIEKGDYMHLALDRTGTPWVGFLDDQTDQGEPMVRNDGKNGRVVNSTLMNRHLRSLVDGEVEKTVRFHFTGETAEDSETGATLHRLEVPEV